MALHDNTAHIRTMFGNFDIQETIGQGGMGVVYRARDVTLNRDVALKVLKDELRENPRVVARFKREAEAIASLDHARIVQVYSVGAVGNIPYFAMEFIEGKPLNRILRRHKFLQWRPALQIAREVAEALEAAHEAGIIHRDIKPGNILVDRSGHAFVSDFGIAKVLSAETQLTVDGSKLGTPQYMSPERVQSQEITIESDLYSLGVVLFQMLTGRLPYDAHDPVELIRMIVVDPPRRIRDYKPELPEDLERLVAYMIEKKPHDRPGSAGQVVELINRLLEGKPLFESDSGIDDALESLREDVSTPHTDMTPVGESKLVSAWSSARRRVGTRWRGLPEWARTLLVAAPLVAAAYAGGSMVSTVGGQDEAPEIARAFSLDQSGWYQAGELVRFFPEQQGVAMVELVLDGYRFGDAAWSAEPAAALAPVLGGEGAGVCLLNPHEGSAGLVVPLGGWRVEDALLTYRRESETGLVLRSGGEGESEMLLARLDTGGGPAGMDAIAERVVEAAVHPHGDRVAVVRREGRHGRVVEEWRLDAIPPMGEALFTSQQEVRGLAYGADGALVFQEQTHDGIETNVVVPGDGRRRLTLGDVRLASAPLSPSGNRLIAFEADGEETRGVVFDAVTGSRMAEFGPARDAAWISDDTAVILSTDASGALQLWRLNLATGSLARVQRTFLAGGVRPGLAVHPFDGTALVMAADGGALAFVER